MSRVHAASKINNPKILITEMGSIKNKGNESILNGTLEVLTRFLPNASITVLTHGPRDELKSFKVRALPAISGVPTGSTLTKIPKTILCLLGLSWAMLLGSIWSGMRQWVGLRIDALIKYRALPEYVATDVVLVRGADTLTDRYGRIGLDGLLMRFSSIFVPVLLRKPTIICGHSIGPFNTKVGKVIARFVLNRVSLITVREKISRDTLREMGVKNPNIYVTADLAFCMQPSTRERAEEILCVEGVPRDRLIVGVSVSRLITDYIPPKLGKNSYVRYIEFMAKLIDAIIERFNVTVMFIPHVTGPGEAYDDRLVASDICKLIRNQDRIRSIKGDYSAEELRRIIGLCEIFIGSRTHAVISAISMHVPSVALSYLPKTHGILEMADQGKWIVDVQPLDYEEAKTKTSQLWENRHMIRDNLATQMKAIQERAFSNGRLVRKLLDTLDIQENQACPVKTEVWDQNLCIYCGSCAGICPNNAISIQKAPGNYELNLDIMKCNGCGICARVCPLLHNLRGNDNIPLSPVTDCYIGHSSDATLLANSTSGGLVTTLLCYALEKGVIDGSLIVRMKKDKPFEPEVTLARTAREVVEASTSRYHPVPLNIGIKEILSKGGKYAVVGLPCHILAFKMAERVNAELRTRVSLHLGLFCLHTLSFDGTEFLLKKIGIQKSSVAWLDYRGKGQPGKIVITLKNGTKKVLDFPWIWETLFGPFFFAPMPCLICPDMTGDFSDLSFGDAFFSRQGWSAVLVRSDHGERILQGARTEGRVELYRMSLNEFFKGRARGMSFKSSVNVKARRALLVDNSYLRHVEGDTLSKNITPNFAQYFLAFIIIANAKASMSPFVQRLLKHAPFWTIRAYALFVYMCRALAS